MRAFVRGFLAMMMLAGAANAADDVNLEVGKPAPAFEAVDDAGKPWKSADRVGKKILVVYFYPAAMTGGCTKQACAFRDSLPKLEGVEVVGVSGDEPEGLALFKKDSNLNFSLLSDVDGAVAKKFGVPLKPGGAIEKEIDGKKYTLKRGVSAARWTFVIGKDGKLVDKNSAVNAAEDAGRVRGIIEKLSSSK